MTLPVYIAEPAPVRPEMILWLELPEDFVVGHEVIDPAGPPVSFRETLLHAMASPLIGAPRKPRRIRVAETRLADEIRAAVPDIEVVVAPTPELDRLIAQMLSSVPPGDRKSASYFENGRIGADAVASLFQTAEALFREAPWKLAADSQVLRLDIPALGVEGACVSVIGALGESLGLIIFPSLLAMERFLAGVDPDRPADAPLDMGTSILSLNFERGAELPAGMRREATEHGWPVAGPAAYPRVQHRDRDGASRPLDEQQVRIVATCAGAVTAFFSKYGGQLEQAAARPLRERFIGTGGIEAGLVMPYEAGAAPDTDAGAPPPAGATQASAPSPAELHEIDNRLVEEMMRFAAWRFGDGWSQAARGLTDREEAVGLLGPFLVYQVRLEKKPVAHWFAREKANSLSRTERAWLLAQQAAWLSAWEVLEVESGSGLKLEDLLTGEVREVREEGASKTLLVRHAILARVVDFEGLSLLCGTYARPLPPREAARIVKQARSQLRRKGGSPKDRLREEKMGRYLVARWGDAVAALDEHAGMPPRLENSDGEALLLTVDRFGFDPSLHDEIAAALATIEGVRPPQPGESDRTYQFDRPGNRGPGSAVDTLLGSARLGADTLRVQTNSRERADRIRRRIETACGDRIRHRSRDHQDPLAAIGKGEVASGPGEGPPPASGDEASALILDFKRRHYAEWCDQPLPALGGDTPRAAVRTRAGREQVDLVLKECESMEAHLPEGQRFDFSSLRRELGLGK